MMYNFRTGEHETPNDDSDYHDFVPQDERAQAAYDRHVSTGVLLPMEALMLTMEQLFRANLEEKVAMSSKQQSLVLAAVIDERSYQDGKWGSIEENPHTVGEWILILRAELEEAEQAWRKSGDMTPVLAEIRQVAAVAVACLEQHGVRFRDPGAVR